MGSRRRDIPEINAGSMADIAFLLLVFFLVTTTMDVPNGLQVALPPISEEPPEDSKQKKREVLEVLVNSADQLLVEGSALTIDKLRQKTMDHLTNEGRNPTLSTTSTKAIVSLKNDRGTSYDMYVQVYNELTAAYNKVRDEYSMQKYGVIYSKLDPLRDEDKIKEVKKKYPKKLSEAEPVSIGG
ncbi:MAG: biopolymer transport protein ExbD [Bacteroidia bacterium]|jgi:biopolymer transport protein ExbD|tara:strand:- start:13739 stop:14290 length:552 start_codon:yes stop_codon:yes gene_type:complete